MSLLINTVSKLNQFEAKAANLKKDYKLAQSRHQQIMSEISFHETMLNILKAEADELQHDIRILVRKQRAARSKAGNAFFEAKLIEKLNTQGKMGILSVPSKTSYKSLRKSFVNRCT